MPVQQVGVKREATTNPADLALRRCRGLLRERLYEEMVNWVLDLGSMLRKYTD